MTVSETTFSNNDDLCEAIGRAIELARQSDSKLTLFILRTALLNECGKIVEIGILSPDDEEYL